MDEMSIQYNTSQPTNKPPKTVYILGAGFSQPACVPLQKEIIGEILKLRDENFGEKDELIKLYLHELESFLENELFIKRADFGNIALEDIFTPIDRCIIDGISFRSHDSKDLVELREKIYSLIIIAIINKLESSRTSSQSSYIEDFAKYLVTQMKPRMKDKDHDPVSVISTNWDILLDNFIKSAIKQGANIGVIDDGVDGVVDYCCYISSLPQEDKTEDGTIKPGLWALGKGGYNVKLLKLHGSMNWLNCPKCQRLFVAFHEKIAEYGIYKDKQCHHCAKNFKEENADSSTLRSDLIMPTFLKDLTNFQIKLIWQNAGVELSEASKIVFIGYSLPQADYELRQLLARMIRHEAEIEVVLQSEDIEDIEDIDKRTKIKKSYEEILKEQTNIKDSNADILKRYRTFFGKRKVTPIPKGVVNYIKTLR